MAKAKKKAVKKQQPALKPYYIAVGFEKDDFYAQASAMYSTKAQAVNDLRDCCEVDERTIRILEVKLATPTKAAVITDFPVLSFCKSS